MAEPETDKAWHNLLNGKEDPSSEVTGTQLYWLEVHRIASILFQKFENGDNSDNALKFVIEVIMETPLLTDIECLSGDQNEIIRPFTTWILQGLLKACIYNEVDNMRKFYIDAQCKLLSSVYDSRVSDFEYLVNLYVRALEQVAKMKAFNSNYKFLLFNDFTLQDHDKILICANFEIRNRKEQINYATVLLEVLNSVRYLIFYHCTDLHSTILKVALALFNSNVHELSVLVLPFLLDFLKSEEQDWDEYILKKMCRQLICIMINSSLICDKSCQEGVVQLWNAVKEKVNINSLCDEDFVQKIVRVKDVYCDKTFVYDVLTYVSSQNTSTTCSMVLPYDGLEVLFGSLINEVMAYVNENKDYQIRVRSMDRSENPITVCLNDVSASWKKISYSYTVKCQETNSKNYRDRFNYFNALLNFCGKSLWKLDRDLELLRFHVIISFFGNDFVKIAEKVLFDLRNLSSTDEDLVLLGIGILSSLSNLPEVRYLPDDSMKSVIDFLVPPLMSDKFQVHCLDNSILEKNSVIPAFFLKSIQSVPPGLPVTGCLSIFSRCATRKDFPNLNIQAVKSVPFLFLTSKLSSVRLISEILSSAILVDCVELQAAAVDSLTDLVCALAGTGYIIRTGDGELEVKCTECSTSEIPEGTEGEVPIVESHLLKFLSQIPLNSSIIKHRLINCIPRLAMHMTGLRNKIFLNKVLPFFEDADESVRLRFSECVNSIIFGHSTVVKCSKFRPFSSREKNGLDESRASALDLVLKKLEEGIHVRLKAGKVVKDVTSLLETVIKIACFPVRKALNKSIRLLLLFINQGNAPLSSIFYEIAAAHRTTQLVLYYSYRPEISQFLGNLIVKNYIIYNQSLRTTLIEITSIFKGLSESRFATKSENYIVPIIFKWALKYSRVESLLYEWCQYVEQTLPVVVSNTFQNIYTYILLNEEPKIFKKCEGFIFSQTGLKMSELILYSQKSIINELLFNYHRSPERVLNALKNVIGEGRKKECIVDCLEARFVGYLLFIVSKFVKDINADSEKIHAIQSLTAVIKLMGEKYVTPVARKVLATLQTTLNFNFSEYYSIHFTALKTFIETVHIEQLGPLLATIITLLLPFLDYDVDVAEMFKYLIVENEKAVEKFLPCLIFVPNHPKIEGVNKVLEKHINFEKELLKDRLSRETSLALHETVQVRMEGLKALRKTIEKSSSEIQNLISGSDEPDACIRTLLEGLILCCSDLDENISVLAASCLGQLGAIDPGLLPRKPKPKNSLPLSVHGPEFAHLALTEITRGFQNARTSVDMDAFAVAIQELLKMYQISPSGENGIWSRFPKQIQDLMTPMLSSRYKVQTPKRNALPDVIFGSKEASSHISWARLWASKLISLCKDDRAVILFKVCEPSLKCDVKVLLFFLRYILLQAVIRDPSGHEGIIKEIESVVKWSRNTFESDEIRTKSRPVRLVDYCGYPSMKSTITSTEAQACAVTVFLLLDFLHSWLRIYRDTNFSTNGDQSHKKDFNLVKDFLGKIDYLQISIANYEIHEYSRAVMYLEDVIGQDKEKLCEHLPLLSKAYALYGDLDSVAGASSFQKTAPKLEDLLLSHRVSGQLEEVRIIFERLGKDRLMTPAHMQEMTRCYLNLGEPYTALNCVQSFTMQQPDLMSILSEGMAESLLKLGDYTQLDKYLENDQTAYQTDWFVQISKIFLALHKDDADGVSKSLLNIRTDVANALRQTSLQFGDYQQCYSYLIKSQILCEIEQVSQLIKKSNAEFSMPAIEKVIADWEMKSSIVQSDSNSLEPLLNIRRLLLNLMRTKLSTEAELYLKNAIGKSWVKSAEIARKAGCFHQSYNYILSAEQYSIPSTFIEKAQLFWDKGDQDLCLFTLSRGIEEYFPNASEMKNLPAGERLEERKMCAEAKLLYAIYSEETSNCDHNTNITNYQNAFDVCRELEKSQAFLAQCFDRVISHLDENGQDQGKVCELKILMVLHFGKSLMHGCEYIYQTVPRMLSIWLDMGESEGTPERVKANGKINKLIEYFLEVLPPFVFMTALPQLLSRLGHPNGRVFAILKTILATLVKAFPQQCLWAVQAVAKSSVQKRVKRYDDFIQHPILRSSSLYRLIRDFTSLCDELNKLANYHLPHNVAFHALKISSVVRDLPRLLASEKFSAIIVPITRFCSISLPRDIRSSTHEPFPKEAVYITGIEEEVTVLTSMQMPRKISFRGSDGKLYDILCKPTDDLRRDGRLMEFNNIVNMYLHRDPESRARSLHIRTYVVIPLGESGGLLEWVPNLVGLRKLLIRLYKQFGKYTSTNELRLHECQVRDPLEKKRSVFVDKLLPLHPPLFPEWFRMTFPDPSGWYLARQSYTRTTAVMSMVGYILGLGDRHGENILFDCESGDTVHVDFNCLFNKGEKFDWKERVPFRLTHNMVAAMGPFGVEGTFRKSCEISLRVLRSQAKTLMSVLTPFAYDPFGSWGKNKEIVQNERDQKIGEADKELSDIEKRLNGSLRVKQKNSTLYLSVEGQARSLIQEATNIDNLCQMYFGWGAYL